MTGRDRWLKLFKDGKIDRVLINPFIWMNSVYEFSDYEPGSYYDFLDPVNFDLNRKAMEYFDYFDFDIRYHCLPLVYTHFWERNDKDGRWKVSKEFEVKGDVFIEITIVKTPERELKQIKSFKHPSKYLWVEAPLEYFIKEQDDLNQFIKYQPSIEDINLDFDVIAEAKRVVGENGIVSIQVPGAFFLLNMYRKLDLLLIDPLVDHKFYVEAMGYFLKNRLLPYIKKIVEAGVDVVNIAGNIATGSMVGPRYFYDNVFEYEKQVIDFVHKLGKPVIYHNCGDTKGLIGDIYNNLGFDGFETLTPPPFGDTIFEEALEKFDNNVVLFGNIDQMIFLREATPAEVKEKIKEIVVKGKSRGKFVLSTSDYILDGTPYENIKAFVETGLEYGRY